MKQITYSRAIVLFALATTLTLGGCAMTTPSDPGPQKTGQQLRAELIADANAAIAASGLPDGWAYDSLPGADPWNPRTDEFLGAACTVGDSRQLLMVDLMHEPVGDPIEFVHRMGDYWKDQGYIVSPVGDDVIEPIGDRFSHYRADRPEGSLAASAVAQTKYFVLHIYTECSSDPTLDLFAGPTGYRDFDMLDKDPYHPTDTPTITPYPDR
ncbi:hypothetical protein ACFQ9V_12310 [Leifsonia sp. NPDC056665]|uniref:hypothetical protein n=1 Tax=Leifsonia sp. NPDC056665 TaxID=3345901 RepID=UPI0036B85B36